MMNILGRILGVLCQAIGLAPMATAQSNSTNSFDLNEVWYVVIGAVIGFVASIGTVIVERILDRRGKLKLYYQISGGRNAVIPYGFQYTQAGSMCFSMYMHIEIQNTSRTTRVIRDVNAILYKDGQPIDHMIQVTSTKQSKGNVETGSRSYGAENGSYSFVVEALSIQHQCCSFIYTNQSKVFDEVRLRYYDEKDKEHTYPLRKIECCWSEGLFEGTPDWVLLK